MSYVDERVVEMRFDNKQFEQGIKTSLDSLEKLDDALKLDGSSKGLEDLQKATNSFSMDSMTKAIDTVNSRFSLLGEIGVRALQNIVDKAVSAGEAMMKSLTVEPVSDGFSKYEQKLQAVQQIMNATGKSIEDVETELDKLAWFTDETSYDFSGMVSNIAKFTSSGVELDQAVTSMIGIANAAGLAGASVTDASHAMDGFSKAMGKGYMMANNWQWIRTAHMDTVQFKQSLLDAAVAEGTLKKTGDGLYASLKGTAVSVEDFESALKDGWMNVNVMNTALNEFGGTTEGIYRMYKESGMLTSDIIELMGDKMEGLGLKAFKASQEAKTFTDAINATKDAVSSGWMKTFQLIFGNFEEARVLWTDLANTLWDVFASSADARNAILETWKALGGREALIEAISNAYYDLLMVLDPIKEALEEVFPPMTGNRLSDLTEALVDFTEKLIISVDAADQLKDAAHGIFSVINVVIKAFKGIISVLSPLSEPIIALANHLLNLIGALGRAGTSLDDFVSRSEGLKEFAEKVRGAVTVVAKLLTIAIDSIATLLSKYVNLPNLTKLANNIVKVFELIGLTAIYCALRIAIAIRDTIRKIKQFLSISAQNSKLSKALDTVAKQFSKIVKFATSMVSKVSPLISKLASAVALLVGALFSKQYRSVLFDTIVDAVEKLKNKFSEAKANAGDFFNNLKSYIQSAASSLTNTAAFSALSSVASFLVGKLSFLKDVFINLKGPISDFFNKFINAKSGMERMKLIVSTIQENFTKLKNVITDFISGSKFGEVANQIKEFVDKVLKNIQGLKPAQVLLFAFGVAITSTIMKIGNAAQAAANMFDAIVSLPMAIKKVLTQLKSLAVVNVFNQVAIGIAILAASIKLLSTIPIKDIQSIAIVLGSLAVVIGLVSIAMAKLSSNDSGFSENSAGLLAFTASIAILAGTLYVLDKIDFAHLKQNLIALAAVVAGVLGVMFILSSVESNGLNALSAAITLVAFSIALLNAMKALKGLVEIMNSGVSEEVIGNCMKLIVALAFLAAAASKVRFGTGVGLLMVLGSVLILRKILLALADSSVDYSAIKNNLNGALLVFGALSLIFAATRLAGEHAAGAGVAVVGIAAAMLIITQVIKQLNEIKFADNIQFSRVFDTMLELFAGMTAILWALGKVNQHALKGAVAMVVLTGVMYLMANLVKSLASFEGNLLQGIVAVGFLSVFVGVLVSALAATEKAKTGPLFMLVACIGIIITAMALLSELAKTNPLGIIAAGLAIAVSLVGLAFAISQVSIASGSADTKSLGLLVGALGMVLLAIGLIVKFNKIEEAKTACIALGGLMLAIAAALWLVSKAAEKAKDAVDGGKAIALAMAGMLPLLGGIALMVLALNQVGDPKTALLYLVEVVGTLAIVLFAIKMAAEKSKDNLDGAKTLALAAASLIPIVIAVAAVMYAYQAMGNSADAIGGIIIALGLIATAMFLVAGAAKFAKDAIDGAKAIALASIGLLAAVGSIAALCYILQNVDMKVIGAAIIGIVGTLFAMAGAAKFAKDAIAGALAIGVVSLSLIAIVGSLALLASIDGKALQENIWVLAGVLGAIATFAVIDALTGNVLGLALAGIAAGLVIFAAACIGFGVAAVLFATAISIITQAIDNLKNYSESEMQTICNNIVMLGAALGEGLAEALSHFVITLLNHIDELLQAGLTAIANGIGFMITFIPSLMLQVVTAIASGLANVVLQFKEVWPKIKEAVIFIGQGLKVLGTLIMKAFIAGITAVWHSVTGLFTNLWHDITDAFKGAVGDAQESGHYYATGVAAGINDGVDDVDAASRNLAKATDDAYCDELGIHSDSDVGIEKGGFYSSGVATGIENMSGLAEDAARQMGINIDSDFTSIINFGAGEAAGEPYGNGVASGLSKTIGPAVDLWHSELTGLMAQAGETQSMVNQLKASMASIQYLDFKAKRDNGEVSGNNNKQGYRRRETNDIKREYKARNEYEKRSLKESEENNKQSKDYLTGLWDKFQDDMKDKFKPKGDTGGGGGSGGGGGGGGGGGSEKAEKETKVYERQIDIMSFASDVVERFNSRYGETLTALGNTDPVLASKQAVELLALQTYQASLKSKTAEEIAEMAADKSKDVLGDLMKEFEDLYTTTEQTLAGQLDFFKKFDSTATKRGADMLSNLQSQIDGFKEWSHDIAILTERGLDAGLIKTLRAKGIESYEEVRGFLDMNEEQLEEYNRLYVEAISLPADIALDTLADYAWAAAEAAGGFGTALTESEAPYDGGRNMVANMAQGIMDQVGLTSDLSGQGLTIADALAKGLEANSDKIMQDATQVGVIVKDSLKSEIGEDKAEEIGKAVVDGLADGITENGSVAVEAIVNLAIEMLEKAKAEVGVASPSKEFMSIGKFITMGLAKGIDDNAADPINAIGSMADSSVEAMMNAATRISDIVSGNLDLDPTIRPVLDLTNVENGAGYISDLLSNQQYSLDAIGSIQNVGGLDIGASVYSAIRAAFAESNPVSTKPNINIYVYGAEGQSEEELVDVIQYRINHEMNRYQAAWGGA